MWGKRRLLMVEQLTDLRPDLIAMQEVSLKGNSSNAHWLAQELNQRKTDDEALYNLYLCPRTGNKENAEGIAILSRFQVKRHEILDLLTQNRVAQLVEFRIEGQLLMMVNGKFFWNPGEAPERKAQIELLLDWLDAQPAEIPVIVAGDFNGDPKTVSIELMREYFDSAHRAVHGEEPEFTCPTPLPVSKRVQLRNMVRWGLGKRPKPDLTWRKTLDYIFVDPRLHTLDCKLVLDKPADNNESLYPSDHFGIYALIKVN
jgi:endonuclease/exonuclease/phosphatase family metal-dependent hydrolase